MNRLRLLFAACLVILPAVSQNVVDVPSHIIPPDYVALLERHGAALEETFPLPGWDAARHVRFMDAAGIACSVLTLPAPQPYFGNSAESRACIRRANEAAAAAVRDYPGRFEFCAALPLPDVEAAVREAVYALDTLGAVGVKLATNARGQYVGDAALDTLMAVLNARGAVIILHPHRPTPYPSAVVATTPLPMYEYPAETTRAVVNMLSRNVLVRYPRLKVVVPHCGSFLPLALPRLRAIYPAVKARGLMGEVDWEANLSRLYFDLAGNPAPEVLRALLSVTEPGHLLYGSDYPYQPDSVLRAGLRRLRATLAADSLLGNRADDILTENARRLFAR